MSALQGAHPGSRRRRVYQSFTGGRPSTLRGKFPGVQRALSCLPQGKALLDDGNRQLCGNSRNYRFLRPASLGALIPTRRTWKGRQSLSRSGLFFPVWLKLVRPSAAAVERYKILETKTPATMQYGIDR